MSDKEHDIEQGPTISFRIPREMRELLDTPSGPALLTEMVTDAYDWFVHGKMHGKNDQEGPDGLV